MYIKEYVFNGDYEVPVYRVRNARAYEREDVRNIQHLLSNICEAEANKLYRLAWRMIRHGCKPENVQKCRDEANWLHMCGYPEQILAPGTSFQYAFKC